MIVIRRQSGELLRSYGASIHATGKVRAENFPPLLPATLRVSLSTAPEFEMGCAFKF
jgi:hypothetical protein